MTWLVFFQFKEVKVKGKFGFLVAAIAVVVLVLGAYIGYYYFLYQGFELAADKDGVLLGVRSGTFGDAFGVINALFSGLAFSGVLITLLMQLRSLAEQTEDSNESRRQIKRQQTESQFYSMLALQQKVVQGFDLHIVRNGKVLKKVQGRDCFRNWRNKLLRRYNPERFAGHQPGEASMNSYLSVMRSHLGDLGLYYRSLYSVFRFIETADKEQQAHFGIVVRSLLSDYELVFLFYNCLSLKGERFMTYAKKYALFDNLNVDLLLSFDDLLLVPVEVYGDNQDALRIVKMLKGGV